MNDFSLTNNINFLKEQCLTNRLIGLQNGLGMFLNTIFNKVTLDCVRYRSLFRV